MFVTGKGISEEIMTANNQAYPLPSEAELPTKEQAVVMHENEGGEIMQPEMLVLIHFMETCSYSNSILICLQLHTTLILFFTL